MIVEFTGKFVHEIPHDKFTVVLKKVKGEESVPLFQTLTFSLKHVDGFHDEHHPYSNGITNDPCTGEAMENDITEESSLLSLFDMSRVSDYLAGMYPVDMSDFLNNPE